MELAPNAPAQSRPLPQRPGSGPQGCSDWADTDDRRALIRHYPSAILLEPAVPVRGRRCCAVPTRLGGRRIQRTTSRNPSLSRRHRDLGKESPELRTENSLISLVSSAEKSRPNHKANFRDSPPGNDESRDSSPNPGSAPGTSSETGPSATPPGRFPQARRPATIRPQYATKAGSPRPPDRNDHALPEGALNRGATPFRDCPAKGRI